MKKKFVRLVLFLFSVAIVFFQPSISISAQKPDFTVAINGKNGEIASGVLTIAMDPTDSSVISVALTNNQGKAEHFFIREFYSRYVLFKIYGIGYSDITYAGVYVKPDEVTHFSCNYGTTGVGVITVGKNGWKDVDFGSPQMDTMFTIMKKFDQERVEHNKELNTKIIRELEEYHRVLKSYRQHQHFRDSILKNTGEYVFDLPTLEVPEDTLIREDYEQIFVTESMIPEGETSGLTNKLWENGGFRSVLKRLKHIRAYFRIKSNDEPWMSELVFCDPKKRIKSLNRFASNMLDKKIRWEPYNLCGRKMNFSEEILFYYDFIYQPD